MERFLINLLAGALGGNAAGKGFPEIRSRHDRQYDRRTGRRRGPWTARGLADPSRRRGGAVSGDLSIGGIITQIVSGGASGAILTAIIGAIKNKAA
jgi:hypothetical protein